MEPFIALVADLLCLKPETIIDFSNEALIGFQVIAFFAFVTDLSLRVLVVEVDVAVGDVLLLAGSVD